MLIAAAVPRGAPADPAPAGWVGAAPLPAGDARVTAVYELSLTSGLLGQPWAIAVDAALGVSGRLTVAISHSARATGTVQRGGGVCLEGARPCPRRYHGGYLDGRWRVRDGRVAVGALLRLGVVGLGPVRPVVRLGARVRVGSGRRWAVAEPEVAVSLGHRELGNRDTLIAPVWFGLDLGRGRAALWLRTGVRGQLVGWSDKYEVALGLGGALAWRGLRLGGEVAFPQLAGPQNTARVAHGTVWLEVDVARIASHL